MKSWKAAAAGLITAWVCLQAFFWTTPPFGDALGHLFPQAHLLVSSGWSYNAVADSRAVEHPPLVSTALALLWKFPGGPILWGHILSTLIGAMALLGLFNAARLFNDERRAFFITAFVASCSVFFAQGVNPYIEISVIAGFTWAIFFFGRRNSIGLFLSVAWFTCSKETTLPVAFVMFCFAAYAMRAERAAWRQGAAIALGVLPCVGWLVYCALVKGSFLSETLTAATTNGSVSTTAYGLARKLTLGWVQLLLLGMWVPGAALLIYRKDAMAQLRTVREPRLMWLMAAMGAVSVVEHGVISISLNRYYLLALVCFALLAWTLVPDRKGLFPLIGVGAVAWGIFSYLLPQRYSINEDWIKGVEVARSHQAMFRRLPDIAPTDSILASYPTTFEASHPYLGYVATPTPVIDFDIPGTAISNAKLALASPYQMNGKGLDEVISKSGALAVRRSGDVKLYRFITPPQRPSR